MDEPHESLSFEECFRNFREKKITKENVWWNNFIDDFQHMIQRHHRSLGNFPLVGSMLEASGLLYGMKVDSVHKDILLLSGGITRQNIIEPTAEDLDESIALENSSRVSYPIRRRRVKTTVVGNKDLINAKLQTNEEANCLLKVANDVTTKSLLQNFLASNRYSLSLQSQNKFWIDRNVPMNELDDDSAVVDAASVDLPVLEWVPSSHDVVRPKVTGYEISNIPCEHFRYPTTTTVDHVNQFDLEDNDHHSSIDFRFDVTADPVPQDDRVVLLPVISESFNLTEDDQNSLRRCTALQRKTVVADDLRPLTCSPLEYSYRRITEGQLSTGPSFWKQPSIQQSKQQGGLRKKRKLAAKDKPVNFKNVLPELMEAKFLSVDDPLAESIRKVHCVKWNPNNLIRPSRVSWSTLQTVAPRICDCIEIYNTNIDIDIAEAEIDEIVDLFPDPMDVDDLVPDPMDVDVADDDNSNLFSNYMDEPPIANDFFPSPFEVDVAPNVAILPVPQMQSQHMQITPANQNVKEITKRCLEIICGYEANGGEATYAYVYHKLHKNNVQVTPALVFAALLQLANENDFHLEKIGENDFIIKRM